MLEVTLLRKTYALHTPWTVYSHLSVWRGSLTSPVGEIAELEDVLGIHDLETDEVSYVCTVSFGKGFAVSDARVSRIDGTQMLVEVDGEHFKPQQRTGTSLVRKWLRRARDIVEKAA